MNMFYRQSINEYRRQISLKESFAIETERLRATIESIDWKNFDRSSADCRELRRHLKLLLLCPLVEIAWADGRISRRESDAVLQIADAYGLTDDDADYCQLLDKLTARPIPQMVGRMWQDFYRLFENLHELERQEIAYCLTVQAQFVAEQSSDNLLAFLRGERVSESERETLRIVAEQLKSAQAAAKSREENRIAAASSAAEKRAVERRENVAPVSAVRSENYESEARLEDYGVLIPLVPLVKTAWAEGRVTKRERQIVFEAASRMGVAPGTSAHRRLSEWLELHPTDDFYAESLEQLNNVWKNLPENEKVLRRLDVLSDCVSIAEASGGTSRYPAGGQRVCDEEFAAVKRIAQKLNAPPPAAPDALISLAA